MSKASRVWLWSSVTTIALIGCATPGPLVRLAPTTEPIAWVVGRATVLSEQAGVRAAIAFEHQDGETLALRVEIENLSDEVLQIDPAAISFAPCQTLRRDSCQPSRAVINPEQVLLTLAQRDAQGKADATNEQALLGTLAILSVVGDAASIGSGHAGPGATDSTLVAVGSLENSAAQHDSAHADIATQQQLWADVALRRNTVFPGHGVGGRVLLPIDTTARYVWVHVRVGERIFSFRFAQTILPAAPRNPPTKGSIFTNR